MGILDKLRAGFEAERTAHTDRLDTLNGGNADEKLLFLAERSFAKGRIWGRGAYESDDGKRCLVGALRAMRVTFGIEGDRSDELLKRAIEEHQGTAPASIEAFNDTRRSYQEVAVVLGRARQLASAAGAPRQAQLLLEHAPSLDRTVKIPSARAKIQVRK